MIKIKRTGNIYSIASSEFEVTYPDGYVGKIWSPPWHEDSPEEEERKALEFANKLYSLREHKEKSGDDAPSDELSPLS